MENLVKVGDLFQSGYKVEGEVSPKDGKFKIVLVKDDDRQEFEMDEVLMPAVGVMITEYMK